MTKGIVTNHLVSLIAKQVEDRSLVVWYDPGADYRAIAEAMAVPDATVARYDGSFLKLRRDIDHLLNGLEPPRLVVYVPMDQSQTHHALVELEEAGVVMQPGQQPPNRNTRFSIVARNALKNVIGEDNAAEVERQVEAGKLTLADVDALGTKGQDITKGVVSIIFGTGNPQDVALGFLASNRLDGEIEKKSATPELRDLVHLHFGLALPDQAALPEIRERLARHVLLTDLANILGDKLPPSLASVKVADTPATQDSCIRLARSWRLRRDVRESYVAASQKVEQEFSLAQVAFDVGKIEGLKPIQIATFDLDEYRSCRSQLSTDEWIDLLLRTIGLEPSHLAFLDRIHLYIPGWEIPKMRVEFFTDHYGFVVDYLAEALRELRKHNFTEVLDRYFSLGSHLNARDVKAVRKTFSGLLKLVFPHGEFSKEELAEVLAIALEGRRRVKEQLKKMGSFEYHQTSFSYIDNESREERYVGVPEQGGRDMISTDPLAPGSVYTASVDDQGRVGLYRIEVGCSPGTGKLKIAGGIDGPMKESIQRAFAYLMGQKVKMGVGQQIDTTDFHVEAIDLLNSRVLCEAGIALVIAVYSAIKKHSVLPGHKGKLLGIPPSLLKKSWVLPNQKMGLS